MKSAFAAESWHTEHRPAMDFHGKMTRYEMEGKSGPSIAQLLDQNLLSPQQAISHTSPISPPYLPHLPWCNAAHLRAPGVALLAVNAHHPQAVVQGEHVGQVCAAHGVMTT